MESGLNKLFRQLTGNLKLALCMGSLLLVGLTFSLYGGTRGKIVGIVIDKSTNEPIIGANLYLIDTELGAATDDDGYFVILNIPPGTYSIVAQFLGYQTQQINDIKIIADLTTTINFQLEPRALESEEAVTVIAEKPLIRPDVTSKLAVVEGKEIVTMPIENLNGAVASRAGITTDAQGNLHFRGGRTQEVMYLVDGQPVDNPLDVGSNALIDNYAIQELQVLSGTFNAEYGIAMSGIINIVTNEGSNRFRGKIQYTSSYLNSSPYRKQNALVQDANPIANKNTNERLYYKEINAIDQLNPAIPVQGDFTGFLSGPLPARIGNFFFSGEYRNENSTLPHGYNFRRTLFGKLTFPLGINKLTASLQYSDQNFQNYNHRFKYLPDNQGHWENTNLRLALKYDQVFSKNAYMNLYVSVVDASSLFRVDNLNYTDYVFQNLDENQEFVISGNSKNYLDLNSKTINMRAEGFRQMNRNHEFKGGVELNLFELDVFDYTKEGENPEDFFLNEYNKKPVTASAYLQDKIEYGSFIINAGLRGDYVDAKGVAFKDIENPFAGLEEGKPEFKLSPRLGIAYPISENTVFHFSYGHFLQFPNFQLIYQNLQFLNIDELAQARIAIVGNPNVRSQKTIAYEFGVAQRIGNQFAINLTAYSKDITDLIGTIYVENQYRYSIFTNNDFARVQGIDISIQKRMSQYWSAQLEYTLSVARGNESTPLEEAYNIFEGRERSIKEFYLDFDRTHDIALNFSLVFPRRFGPSVFSSYPFQNLNLYILGQFSSGLPYTPISDDRTKLFEKNSARMPWTNTVDVRLEKFFPLRTFTFSLFLQVTNLFDRLNPLIVQPRTGKVWDDGKSRLFGSGKDFRHNPSDVGPPRIIKLGLSTAF